MELRQLKYFVTIAKEKQFVKAAYYLNLSQSALSQQINLLEKEIGVELFDKQKRKINRIVELTKEGKVFLKDAQNILDLSESALDKIRKIRNQKKVLRLGIYRMIHNQRVIDILGFLGGKFPNHEIKIEEYETHIAVQESLNKDFLDFGITVKPILFKKLDYIPLKESELNILLYKGHILEEKNTLELENLKNENWIEINESVHPIYEEIENYCNAAGFKRESQIVQKISSLELLCHFVSQKKGIAFVPSFLDTSMFPNLIIKRIATNPLKFEQCLAFLKKRNYFFDAAAIDINLMDML